MFTTTTLLALAALTSVNGIALPVRSNVIDKRLGICIGFGCGTTTTAPAVPAIPVVGTTTNGWTSSGCYSNGLLGPILSYPVYVASVTQEKCQNTCGSLGYSYAGITGGTDCYCDWSVDSFFTGSQVTSTKCNLAAVGNTAQNGGGSGYMVVFQKAAPAASSSSSSSSKASTSTSSSSSASSSSSTSSSSSSASKTSASTSSSSTSSSATATPTVVATPTVDALSLSQSISASNAAALSVSISASNAASLSASISASNAASVSASASVASASASAAAASASASASAAAAAALATTIPAGWAAGTTPCIAEGTTGRALTDASYTSPNMTWNSCITFCSAKGFQIAGVEYSSECYCGNVLSNGAALNIASSQCNMQCSGSSSICGGPSALTLFVSSAAIANDSPDLTTKKMTLPNGWAAASTACIAEGTSGRALASASTSAPDMTVPKCLAYCGGLGWQYAGVEYGSECYCGDALVNGASLDKTATCSSHCAGDASTYCGGGNALSLYQNPALAKSKNVVNKYASQGCMQEVAGRALTGSMISQANMSIDLCTATCGAGGYTYAGLEYGQECFCGNALVNNASISTVSTQCNMACAGNSAQICGGPNAINLYKLSA